jgi:hypothetical protein
LKLQSLRVPTGAGAEKINKYNDVYGTGDGLYLRWGFGGPSAVEHSQGQQAAGKRQQPTENSGMRERLMQTNCGRDERPSTPFPFKAR